MTLKKNQTIAVIVTGSKDSVTQTDAENLQYNLLGRGFRWFAGSSEYYDLSGESNWVLFVDIKTKLLYWQNTWHDTDDAIKTQAFCVIRLFSFSVSDVVKTILAYMKNPPQDYVEIKGMDSDSDQKVRVYIDPGAVQFYEDDDHLLTTDKATIKGVAKELGLLNENKVIATVQFSYPDSTSARAGSSTYSCENLLRTVQVIEMNDEFLTGTELYRDGYKTNTYKKYRLNKIVGWIVLVAFSNK